MKTTPPQSEAITLSYNEMILLARENIKRAHEYKRRAEVQEQVRSLSRVHTREELGI